MPATGQTDKQIKEIDTKEVSITFAPAVREKLLMTKASEILNEAELVALAKSLGIAEDKIETIPVEEIKKTEEKKTQILASEEITKGLFDGPAGGGAPAPAPAPPAPAPVPPAPDPAGGGLDKSASNAIAAAGRMLAPFLQALPPQISQYFQSQSGGGATPPPGGPPAAGAGAPGGGMAPAAPAAAGGIMKTEESVELFKNTFPGVMESVVEAATAPLKEQIEKSEKTIADLVAAQESGPLLEIAKSISQTPDAEVVVLTAIKKSMTTEDFDKYIEGRKAQFRATPQAFQTLSKAVGEADSSDPEEKLKGLAAEIKKSDPTLSEGAALSKAMADHPDLAREYNRGMDKRAAMVGPVD